MKGLREEIERVVAGSADAGELICAAVEVLDETVPADAWCSLTCDPATMLPTGLVRHFREPGPLWLAARIFEIDYGERDYIPWFEVAQRDKPVGELSRATGGELERSVWYRDIMAPLGYRHMVRLVLRDRDRVWGHLGLLRGSDSASFSSAELDALAGLSGPLASAMRRSVLRTEVGRGEVPEHAALLVFDGSYRLVSITPAAERWLGYQPGDHVPVSALGVAVRTVEGNGKASVRVWSPAGGWATLHGWQLGPDQIAVSIEPSRPDHVTSLVLDAYGLSAREQEITRLVLLGLSTADIAKRLFLSPYTVQDHLKAIFDKTGIRSRRELAAELLYRHYLPRWDDNDGTLSAVS